MSSSNRALRARVREQLRHLNVQPPLQMDELCRRFGEQRGRPIDLQSLVLPARTTAVTFVTSEADIIVYQRETTRAHQHFACTHELGHLMLGHQPDTPDREAVLRFWQDLMPNLPSKHLQGALMRSCSDHANERAAETVARIVRAWTSVLDHLYPAGYDPDTPPGVRGGLSERQGWL